MANTLYVIGIGPGHPDYLVPKGHNIIKKMKTIVGSARALEDFARDDQRQYTISGKLQELVVFLQEALEDEDVAVLVSGDTGYYSLLKYLKEHMPSYHIEVIPGISSMSFAFARLQESWHDAELLSFHGRIPSDDALTYEKGRKLGFLTDKEHNPARIAQILIEKGWPKETKAAALERLSYDDEKIVRGTLEDISKLEGFYHAVLVVMS